MAWSEVGQNKRATATAALITAVSLHTGDPGAAGTTNEVSGGGYARQTPSFGTASGGVVGLTANLEYSGPAETGVAYAGFWDGSDFLGSVQRTSGDAAFNAAGEYNITQLNVTSTGVITA